MVEELEPAGFRESILKEVFGTLGFEEAVSLIGILCQYRIVFSRTFRTLLQDQKIDIDLDPLEPQAAATLFLLWKSDFVTLSEAKGLETPGFFAPLRMTMT